MVKITINRVIAERNGFLGFIETRDGRAPIWHPAFNFTYRILALINASEIACQRVCIEVTVAGCEQYFMVCMPSSTLSEPQKLFLEVSTQVKGVPILHLEKLPLNPFVLWAKNNLLEHLTNSPKSRRPVEMIGLQTQLLQPDETGQSQWKKENVEWFLHPRLGILGADGLPHPSPQTIWDPKWFINKHSIDESVLDDILVKFTDTGRFGILRRLDAPYTTKKSGEAYFEDFLIVAGMLMLSNNPGLDEVLHFNATMVVLGASNMGKTDSLMNGLGCCANINNMVSGSTTPAFVRDRRNMMSLTSAFDDCSSLKTEENAVMETAQKAGHGTKTHGFKKALGGYAISTNLQMARTIRIMGRTVYVFKSSSPFDKTRDAASDLHNIVSHQKALHSREQPLLYAISMSADWFDEQTFHADFAEALAFVYENTPFELARDCLIYAGLNILISSVFIFIGTSEVRINS